MFFIPKIAEDGTELRNSGFRKDTVLVQFNRASVKEASLPIVSEISIFTVSVHSECYSRLSSPVI